MKKSTLLAGIVAVGSAFALSTPASALSVNVAQGTGVYNGGTNAVLDLGDNGSIEENYGYYLGSFNLTIDGVPNFVAFCLDLQDSVNFGGTYTYVETSDPFDDFTIGSASQIKTFFDFNFGGLSTATEFAAFQLGLWELVYDGPIAGVATDNFTTGQLKATGSTALGSIIDTASKFLNNIFGSNPDSDYELTFLDSLTANGDKQDLVYAVESAVGDVPLPAAAWLLGGGMIGLFGFGRFKKGRKAAA